jgi:hypothetical protein
VGGNPVRYIDPWGLYHCVGNANCDITPETHTAMQCMDTCLNRDLAVTSARRLGSTAHPNSSHSRGEACDVGRGANPGLDKDEVAECFVQCFPNGFGQEENNSGQGTHFHFQLNTVPGGTPRFAPDIQPYNP